jgi:uncharacterized hydantoinase/oxoprolinase family protein
MLTIKEITELAQYIYSQQVKQIVGGLSRVYVNTKALAKGEVPIVVTGLGKDFLARKAAESVGADSIVDLEEVLPVQAVLATPAVGVTLMTANVVSEAPIAWP